MALPALLALGGISDFLKNISIKQVMLYLVAPIVVLFYVWPKVKDLFSDNRTTDQRALDAVNNQRIASLGKTLSRKMGTFRGQSIFQQYTEDMAVYNLVKDLSLEDFEAVATVYQAVNRNGSSLRDDMHLYVRDVYLKRLKKFNI